MKKYANKFKAIFVLLLALAFVLPFAACGDQEETEAAEAAATRPTNIGWKV